MGRRLWAASRISILAIVAFDVGMGASMLLVAFVGYSPTSMAFWLVMWGGMWLGFATAYPMVWWLLPKDTTASPSPVPITRPAQVEAAH